MRALPSRTRGALCIIGAAVCFACMSACVRLAGDLPVMEKAFFRNFIAVLLSAVLLRRERVPFRVEGREARRFVLLRCVLGTAGLVLNFYAIDRIPLADANMLNKLSPFFAIIFSRFLLKERVRPVQALTVAGAFAGALLIMKPTGEGLSPVPALAGMFGGMAAGAAYTCLRRAAGAGAAGRVIVFWFSCFSCLFTLPFLLAGFVPPTPVQLLFLLLCGCCGAGGQLFITAAYSCAPAREISVYDYTQVLFSALLGYCLFDQVPDLYSLAGYVLVIGMGVISFLYNNRPAGAGGKGGFA